METQELGGRQEGEQITDHLLPEEDHHLQEEQEVGDDGDGEGGEVGLYSRGLKQTEKSQNVLQKPVRECWPGTGYYGIFQLSDRIFCDSGENPTRNLCKTRCSGECGTATQDSGPPWWTWAGLTHAFWCLCSLHRR